MFHDLKAAYDEMMKHSHRDTCVAIPAELFLKFEQEYKLCFVEPEDDEEFQDWQNEGEDE